MKAIDKETDRCLRRLIQSELPEAPTDTWFVRKTLNRLPDKPQQRHHTIGEILCYALALVAMIAAWALAISNIISNGLTANSAIQIGSTMAITLFCIALLAAPTLRSDLRI